MSEELKMFDREELIKARDRAISLSLVKGTNPLWKSALRQFASSADYLDAMIARIQEVEPAKPTEG